jgi:hypothetical protein
MAVAVSPSTLNLDGGGGNGSLTATMSFPAATKAAGYICRAANVGGEGIRTRVSILTSPTMFGLPTRPTPDHGDCTNMDMVALLGLGPGETVSCFDVLVNIFGNIGNWDVVLDPTGGTDHLMNAYFDKRTIAARIVALGLVHKTVALEVDAYSNRVGRAFRGFGFIRINKKQQAGSLVLQQNSPNPFNPVTKINFAVDKPGNVSVRVFNTRGELVRTITNQWYPQGEHTVSWDGKTQSGGHASSGIYYIKANSGGVTDVIKAVMAK